MKRNIQVRCHSETSVCSKKCSQVDLKCNICNNISFGISVKCEWLFYVFSAVSKLVVLDFNFHQHLGLSKLINYVPLRDEHTPCVVNLNSTQDFIALALKAIIRKSSFSEKNFIPQWTARNPLYNTKIQL